MTTKKGRWKKSDTRVTKDVRAAEVSPASIYSARSQMRTGLSIKWKFMILICLSTILILGIFGAMVYSTTIRQVDDEILKAGIRSVQMLACVDFGYWEAIAEGIGSTEVAGTQKKLAHWLLTALTEGEPRSVPTSFETALVRKYLEVEAGKAKVEEVPREEIESYLLRMFPAVPTYVEELKKKHGQDKLERLIQDLQSEEAQRRFDEYVLEVIRGIHEAKKKPCPLEGIKDDETGGIIGLAEIVDVIILGGSDPSNYTFWLTATGKVKSLEQRVLRGRRDIDLLSRTLGITIGDATVEVGDKNVLSRMFRKAVYGGATETVRGHIIVCLSVEKIDEVKNELLSSIAIFAVGSILISGVVAFLLASFITKPLRFLMADIDTVSSGNLDHVTVSRSRDEIGVLARTFNVMTKNLKAARDAEIERKALEHEMHIASEIQANLLPKKLPQVQGYDIGAYYRPSKDVGGDYYDFFQIDNEHMGIIVADVSGKGVPGSLVMTMARSLIRMEAQRNLSTADTLCKVNRMIAQDIKKGMFVTAMYIILNVRTHTILVSSAGHNPLVLWRPRFNKAELVNPNGIALGFDRGPVFERAIKEEKLQLTPHDRGVAYTDGVVEAMNEANEQFGEKRFYSFIRQFSDRDSHQFVNLLIKMLDEFKGNAPQHDDITVATFRFMGQ